MITGEQEEHCMQFSINTTAQVNLKRWVWRETDHLINTSQEAAGTSNCAKPGTENYRDSRQEKDHQALPIR